jgi:LacI family transcriptional regulator
MRPNLPLSRKLRQVALIYDARLAYDLKVMTGVAAYLNEHPYFSVYIEENALKDQRLPNLQSWNGDGIIADFDDPAIASAVVQSRLPVVGFGSGYGWYAPTSSIPYFFTNNRAVAEMAADHLLALGLRNFAYCGYAHTAINGWSEEREKAFSNKVAARGFACRVYRGHHKTSQWASIQRSLGTWLKSLPKPLGVMAANDNRARQVLEACRAVGLHVPQEVAVVGVDNDELLCQLSSPLLTSVELGAKHLGYQAAQLLDRLMRGRKSRMLRFVVDPLGIVDRQSTELISTTDSVVATAMAFIHNHVSDGVTVQDVLAEVALSRSGLEIRFKDSLGCTIRTAIRRVQLQRARRLVSDTSLALKQIAAGTGFRSVQHMTTLFAKTFGAPPGKYRRATSL